MKWKQHLLKYFSLMLLRYPLAVIAVIFYSTKDKLHVTKWKWLETIDWPLTGDNGWREEHLVGDNPLSTYNRIRWLWRNGGNRYNYEVIGVCDDQLWREGIVQGYGYFERPDGAWLKRIKVPLFGTRFIQLTFGWNIFGPQHGLCKYVCTIRIKTKD
jgi:hypothetical protein